jgi:hypothetical protein
MTRRRARRERIAANRVRRATRPRTWVIHHPKSPRLTYSHMLKVLAYLSRGRPLKFDDVVGVLNDAWGPP